jgi:hypothetical protein
MSEKEEQQQKLPSLHNNKYLIAVNNPKQTISYSFVLCDICHWCSTYLDKTRLPVDNKCPECYNTTTNTLSSFPIMSNESFTFDYDEKHGVELKFMHRK